MRSDELDTLLQDAAKRAARYLDALPLRPVAPPASAVAGLAALDVPLPDRGTDARAVLAELDAAVSPATMAMAGPRFFGFVIGGALPATLAASVLATAWDQNSARYDVTPGTAARGGRGAAVGGGGAPASARHAPAASSPARRSRTSPRSPRRVTPCSPARDGTWRREGCSGRRRSRWSSAPRRTSASSRRWRCSGSAASASSSCPWTGRAGCGRTPCPGCRPDRSSACRPAT